MYLHNQRVKQLAWLSTYQFSFSSLKLWGPLTRDLQPWYLSSKNVKLKKWNSLSWQCTKTQIYLLCYVWTRCTASRKIELTVGYLLRVFSVTILSIQWSILSKFYPRKRKIQYINKTKNTIQFSTSIDRLQQRWHTLGISDVFHSFLHDDVAELAGHPEGQHPQTGFFTFITHLLLGFGRLEILGRMMMCSICVWRLCLVLSQYNRMNLYRFWRA